MRIRFSVDGKMMTRARYNAGMSQKELSIKSGVAQNCICHIENGVNTPRISTVRKICNALGLEIEDVITIDDSEEREHVAKRCCAS